MPVLIRTIDEISKELADDILLFDCNIQSNDIFSGGVDKTMLERVTKFCLKQSIDHELVTVEGYLSGGPLYLVVKIKNDPEDLNYQQLVKEYEHSDGSMKFKNCIFTLIPKREQIKYGWLQE